MFTDSGKIKSKEAYWDKEKGPSSILKETRVNETLRHDFHIQIKEGHETRRPRKLDLLMPKLTALEKNLIKQLLRVDKDDEKKTYKDNRPTTWR